MPVKDEAGLAEMLAGFLRRERFVVDHLGCMATAREAAVMVDYDLALLDRTLPGRPVAAAGAAHAQSRHPCHHPQRAARSRTG